MKPHSVWFSVVCAALVSGFSVSAQKDPFAEMVRTTEPLSAAEQLKKFKLPPGFEIQLVASEPEISKPMNIAFDAKGRLWLTQSREYPFPAPLDQPGRDKVMLLENFATDGRAQKITTFADGLNIPIGLYPYKNGVLAFSIPEIYFFEDTNNDGRADKKETFLGKFGWEKDAHGLTGAFRRGYDGWLYADHGFNNDSTLTAKDGSQIKLNSGNVYRVKMDGSSIEQFSHGQVNPFGLNFDHLGDLWSSDCHSSPVYMLLRGGYYPSFGKPHDGLGYAPDICAHSHGSTAIAGIAYYHATNFPTEYQHNTFIGNVMTSRINRDSYVEHGSTRIAKEEGDFVECDDPWFRPVDIQLGPDGALYVADFYNRIIGHYEVPLDHPGRDRERGRIWRIVYTGGKMDNALALPRDLKGLVAELGHPNITRRLLAMNELSDSFGSRAITPLKKVLSAKKGKESDKIHAAWVLHRLNALDEKTLLTLAKNETREVRVHAMRIASETKEWTAKIREAVLQGLNDSDAYAQRAAADALGRHPQFENIQPLLAFRQTIDPKDSQLLHTVRMALRDQLLDSRDFAHLLAANFLEADSRAIAEAALGVKSPQSGQYLLKHVMRVTETRPKMSEYLRHIARHAPEEELSDMARVARSRFADDLDFQLALLKSVIDGTAQRGTKLPQAVNEWGAALADRLLASIDPNILEWRNVPIPGNNTTNPWLLESRNLPDGAGNVRFITSFARGSEQLTGILRSKAFDIPVRLKFLVAGHDGVPGKPAQKKNLVRLREEESNRVLMEAFAPRNDVAQPVDWDLSAHVARKGYIEVIDADTGTGYAWIAVGEFEPVVAVLPGISPNQIEKRQVAAAELAEHFRLQGLEARIAEMLRNENGGVDARAAAAKALLILNASAHLQFVGSVLLDAETQPKLREKAAQALAQVNRADARSILVQAMESASGTLQTKLAVALASSSEGAEALLSAVEEGKASPRILQEAAVKDRVGAAKPKNFAKRVEALTKGLSPLSAEKQKLIDQRRAAYNSDVASVGNGAQIFAQSCAACHQLDGQGTVVGPQLDGVGNRGLDRLLEDILDPNRNVDHAFRYSNVTLKDDQVITGLFRREEGQLLIFADATGREISVPKADIDQRQDSENSLMPDNFDETMSEQELNDLIAFLLTKGGQKK
ncbi:MAG: c-type cytochrome [Verrucomicrobia bacterium]|nr:c-type cytochrome [Verrucomicrobiota bacterium]